MYFKLLRKLLTLQQSYRMWRRKMFNLVFETRRKSTKSYTHVSKTYQNVCQRVALITTQSIRFKDALKMLCAKYHLISTFYRDMQSWTSKWSLMGNDPVTVTWLNCMKIVFRWRRFHLKNVSRRSFPFGI